MDAYDYGLPAGAIAQFPAEPRSSARLLVAPGLSDDGVPGHGTVADLPNLLRPGDIVVVNDTLVLAARLELTKATGGRAEVLLLEPVEGRRGMWQAMLRPGRRLPESTLLFESLPGPPVIEVGGIPDGGQDGRRLVRLLDPSVIDRAGSVPLPPYIHGALADPGRYQTVYASPRAVDRRSVAAPTAGLHFTPDLLAACRAAGAAIASVELAIGLDTFRPVTAATAEAHVIHSERYSVPAATLDICRSADRVVAVGTTVVRALETAASTGSLSGRTSLYIHGDYEFSLVDVLVTNFHMPRSTLLLMIESFYGPRWRELYATALTAGYRFLSFGDAMVIDRAGGCPSVEPDRPRP